MVVAAAAAEVCLCVCVCVCKNARRGDGRCGWVDECTSVYKCVQAVDILKLMAVVSVRY